MCSVFGFRALVTADGESGGTGTVVIIVAYSIQIGVIHYSAFSAAKVM